MTLHKKNELAESGRIDIIDGFRALAILSVIFYHYYTRWTIPNVNYHPLNNIFSNGYYGVNFFFIISGFVIFYTLQNTNSYKRFIIKRYIRLFPPILLCTFISYFFVKYFDKDYHFPSFHPSTALDFIPSLTFTNAAIWNYLFNRNDINIFCGSYWTLWIELCFYYCAGLVYYINRESFLKNWLKLAIAIILLRIITYSKFYFIYSSSPTITEVIEIIRNVFLFLNFPFYVVYFTLGIFFYSIFSKRKITAIQITIVCTMSVIELYTLVNYVDKVLFVIVVCLFLCFLFVRKWLSFFKNPLILRIGLSSYTLFLLQENIGVVIIDNLSALSTSSVVLKLIPVVVLLFMLGISEIIFRFYEKPVNSYLKRKIGKPTLKATA